MKRLLLTLLIVAVASSAWADEFIYFKKKAAGGAWSCPVLFCENFEGANADNTGVTGYDLTGWNVSGPPAGYSPDNTTHTMEAAQNLYIVSKTSGDSFVFNSLGSAVSDIYIYFLYWVDTFSGGSTPTLLTVGQNTTTATGVLTVNFGATRTLSCLMNASSPATVATMSAGTLYHVWASYRKGAGTNSFCEVAFSTNGVKPTSGNNYTFIDNGTRTANAQSVAIYASPNATQQKIHADKIRVNSSAIGDNPQ